MSVNQAELGQEGRPVPAGSGEVGLAYIDEMIDHVQGGDAYFWRNMHWGIFEDPEVEDDDPVRYLWAAGRMTERILVAGEVSDGARVLDVGCGFGGTLDYIRERNQDCRLAGVNIDERQLRQGRQLVTRYGASSDPIPFLVADGCTLPVADQSLDHLLAVECVFHFPSRKRFFREAARVLRPGGTLALSDFLLVRGAVKDAATRMTTDRGAVNDWFGGFQRPKTAEGYERLGRATGFDVLVNDDVTAATLPTYPALRRLARDTSTSYLNMTVSAVDALEALAVGGMVAYHILSFRRRGS